MSEKKKRYTFDEAWKEGHRIRTQVVFERAKDYDDAEKQVEDEQKKAAEIESQMKVEKTKKALLHVISDGYLSKRDSAGENGVTWREIKELNELHLPEIEEAKKNRAYELLDWGLISDLSKLEYQLGPLPEDVRDSEEFRTHVRNGVIRTLGSEDLRTFDNSIEKAIEIARKFSVQKEELELPEVQEASKIALVNTINQNDLRSSELLLGGFDVSNELTESEEVRSAIKQQVIKLLTNRGYLGNIINTCQLDKSQEVKNDPDVYDALKVWMAYYIKNRSEFSADGVMKVKEEFGTLDILFDEPEIKQAIKIRLINDFLDVRRSAYEEFKQIVDIPSDIVSDSEVQAALKQGIEMRLASSGAETAKMLMDDFKAPIWVG